MKVLVTGAGRGGTNLLTELIRKISDLKFTSSVEDRNFFKKELPNKYATKLATEHPTFTIENLENKIKSNDDLKICMVLRNPIDNCLSKIYRGRPKSQGGDKPNEKISEDATEKTCVDAIEKTYKILSFLNEKHKDKLLVVTMEDIITETEKVVSKISNFLSIEPKEYEGFQNNNRNVYQKRRYKNKLNENQINLHKDLKNSYGGFFENKPIKDNLEKSLSDIIKEYKKF